MFLNSLHGILESHVLHKTTVLMKESRFMGGFYYFQPAIPVCAVTVVLRSRKRAGRRGMREDHCLCMVSFFWD